MKLLTAVLVVFTVAFAGSGCSEQRTVVERPKNDRALKDIPKMPAPSPGFEELVK